jgi:hypothetical protein
MLYTRITALQRHLEAKNEEVENLKRQLAANASLKDLGTLTEQLREAKREGIAWQKRAQIAERRLERLSQIAASHSRSKGSRSSLTSFEGSTVDEIQGHVDAASDESRHLVDVIRTFLHGGLDGAQDSEESIGSLGTVLRRDPVSDQLSSGHELICFSDDDNLSVSDTRSRELSGDLDDALG